ncbi:EpsG family protein [Bacteroides sp.]|uniref:EpsG family protein n=1 Tax=Bacteroides sp. TaxID=29523 RepID=UPI002590A845|nr:EpsG family protein [Bacteroides sp.]
MITTYFLYNSILLFSSFFAFCGEKVNSKKEEYLCRILVFMILWIPASLRYGIGTDYFSYKSIYDHLNWYTDELEIGYIWLNMLFNSFTSEHEYLFSTVAAITYAPICFGMPKKGYSILVIFYVLTLYLSSYSMMRQSIAIAYSLYAAIQLLKGKEKLYFISIIFGSMFHMSALLLLPCYFLKYIRFNLWLGILITVFGAIFIAKNNFISMIFESEIFLNSPYGVYASNSFSKETEMGSGLGLIARCVIPIIIIFLASKIEVYYRQNEKIKNGFIVGLSMAYIFSLIFASQIHIFNRLVDIVSFMLILGAGIIYIIHFKYRKIVILFLYVLFLILFEHSIYTFQYSMGSGLGISPYKSIFYKQ